MKHDQVLPGVAEGSNLYGIRTPLQADRFAGMWASAVYYEEAVYLLNNIAHAPGTPWNDPAAHGTEQEHLDAFGLGYQTGDPSQCSYCGAGVRAANGASAKTSLATAEMRGGS